MNNGAKKLLILLLAIQPLFLVALVTFYRVGYQEFGDPAEYYQKQQEMMQALKDSLDAQLSVVSPDNVGDSTLVGMAMHADIFQETKESEMVMTRVKTALDSLQREKETLTQLSLEVERKQKMLDDLKQRALDEKIVELAKIYDGMKPPQSAPLFVAMEDTLAVLIMSNMQSRTASKVLGSIAESDIEKAKRITKLLAFMGALQL